jgi:tRNA(Ile)-lysidine synthase
MRLAKGSGIDGLAGMPRDSIVNGVRVLRPLLPVAKERLRQTCEARAIPFVVDPSNRMERFARGRLRQVMPQLAAEGMTIERLVDLGARAAEARDALEHATQTFLRDSCRLSRYGMITLDRVAFTGLPRAIALRVLSVALRTLHPTTYAAQHTALTDLYEHLLDSKSHGARTLGGCLIARRTSVIEITREPFAVQEVVTIRPGDDLLWDGHWHIAYAAGEGPAYQLRALGPASHALIDRLCPGLRRAVPRGRIRAVLPALWDEDGKLALIPFANETSRITAEIKGFLTSVS